MTDRTGVSRWLAAYEMAWRTEGTARLTDLFTADATYLQSPYAAPILGLDRIREVWDTERDGPDEIFSLATEIIAVEETVAVVRAEVSYGDPVRQEYRDLWVLRLEADGLCSWFEEWPYWPGQPHAASGVC